MAPPSSTATDPSRGYYDAVEKRYISAQEVYNRWRKPLFVKNDDYLGDLAILRSDIISNILFRIPFKRYVQLRILSKGWNQRISKHLFWISHEKILIPCNPLHSIYVSSYLFGDHPRPDPGSTIVNGDTHIVIVGSLYGSSILMVDTAISYSHKLFIYNPFTKSKIDIPEQPKGTSQEDGSLMSDCRAYGFGYSHPCDPKIVILSQYGGFYSYSFSFAKNSWNQLKFKEHNLSLSITSVAEKLFPDGIIENIALCLDLNTMVFQEILFGSAIPIHTLGTNGGELCALVFVEKTHKEKVKEEEEEEVDEQLLPEEQGQDVEQPEIYERDLWWPTANKDGFYDVRVFFSNSNHWNSMYTTSLSEQQEFDKFHVMTFLDRGQILLKGFSKKDNQDSSLYVYDIDTYSSVKITVPPTLHVGNHHATEYQDSMVEGFGALRFSDVHDSPSSSSTTTYDSSADSPSSIMDQHPDFEIEYGREYDATEYQAFI